MANSYQEQFMRGELMVLFATVQVLLRTVCELSNDENLRNVLIDDILSLENERSLSPAETEGSAQAKMVFIEFLRSL